MKSLAPALTLLLAPVLFGCATPSVLGVAEEPGVSTVLNLRCPRSGKPVAPDSLTTYRGYTVGFCNTHCRDDFAANRTERPQDRAVFDRHIVALQDPD